MISERDKGRMWDTSAGVARSVDSGIEGRGSTEDDDR